MAEGDIGAIIDTLEFDVVDGANPNIIHVSGNVFAVAYKGFESDGWVCTVEILANGQIGAAVIDTLEFDVVDGATPNIIHVSGDVFAIAYAGFESDGQVCTVEILANGQIGAAVIDTLEFDAGVGLDPNIIHVSGDVFAIAYGGAGTDGWMCTVAILTNGQIGAAVIDTLEFDVGGSSWPRIVHVSGNVFAVAYSDVIYAGKMCTVEILTDGQIGAAVIDTLGFDAVRGISPNIIHVSGNVFAIAYAGFESDGWVCTVEILANGQIGAAVIDTLEFDAADGANPNIIHVSGNVFAVAYKGPDDDGWMCTVDIEKLPVTATGLHLPLMGIG